MFITTHFTECNHSFGGPSNPPLGGKVTAVQLFCPPVAPENGTAFSFLRLPWDPLPLSGLSICSSTESARVGFPVSLELSYSAHVFGFGPLAFGKAGPFPVSGACPTSFTAHRTRQLFLFSRSFDVFMICVPLPSLQLGLQQPSRLVFDLEIHHLPQSTVPQPTLDS